MQTLNISKAKKIQFEVNINGVNSSELEGLFEFIVEGVHYGFPVEINNSSIKVELPPLTEVIKTNISTGNILECKLSVYGNGFYLTPWKGEFEADSPVQMEAHMTLIEDEEDIPEPNLDSLTEAPGPSPMRVEHIKRKNKKDLVEKEDTVKLMKQIIKEEITYIKTGKKNNSIKTESKIRKTIRRKVKGKLLEILKNKKVRQSLINEATSKKPKCDCSVGDPIALMESVGMTNKNTQERMIDMAKRKAGNDPDSIFDTIKTMVRLTKNI